MSALCNVKICLLVQDPKGNIHKFTNLDQEEINVRELGFEVDEMSKIYDYKKKDVKINFAFS